MSILGFLNQFIFQLLFFRVSKWMIIKDGAMKVRAWGIIFFVVPFTGYGKVRYRYLGGKMRYLRFEVKDRA